MINHLVMYQQCATEDFNAYEFMDGFMEAFIKCGQKLTKQDNIKEHIHCKSKIFCSIYNKNQLLI